MCSWQLGKWSICQVAKCQLHISVNRTAQIYLELHFCVELHTKKPWLTYVRKLSAIVTLFAAKIESFASTGRKQH